MVDHRISPHWSMDLSRDAVASMVPRFMLERPPDMLTWYEPAVPYWCERSPSAVKLSTVPSPQSMVSVWSECTLAGMVTVWLAEVVSQVVMNSFVSSPVNSMS